MAEGENGNRRLYAVVVKDVGVLARLAQTRRVRQGFVAAVVFIEADRGDIISMKKRFRDVEVLTIEQAVLSMALMLTAVRV